MPNLNAILLIRMKLNEKTKKIIEEVFQNQPRVLAVYLFGSKIAGYADKSSDLDIAVVVDNTHNIDYGQLTLTANRIFPDAKPDLRIITKNTSPTFIFQVIKTGQNIYQRSDKNRVQFEARALSEYYDGTHRRDIYDSYLKTFFAKE